MDKWNDAASRISDLEAELKDLMKEVNGMDGAKIKADILQLFKITANVGSKDLIEGLKEDLRRIKQELADSAYEITNTREQIAKTDKDMKTMEKNLKKDTATNRAKIDACEATLNALKKTLNNEEKRQERLKQAKNSPAGSVAGATGDLADLEDDLRLLRFDHDKLSEEVNKALPQMQGELETKASKADLEELEQRIME